MGSQLLSQRILERILEKSDIENRGPYFALVNRLTSLVMKGASNALLESAIKIGSSRLEGGIVEQIAEMFYIEQ